MVRINFLKSKHSLHIRNSSHNFIYTLVFGT